MFRRRSRSSVALATAILLLLCQTALAAQACAHAMTAAPTESVRAPCHETTDAGAAPAQRGAALTGCEAAKAIPDAVKLPLAAVTDLQSLPVVYVLLASHGAAQHAPAALAVCHSPPLSILHCRFLN